MSHKIIDHRINRDNMWFKTKDGVTHCSNVGGDKWVIYKNGVYAGECNGRHKARLKARNIA